MFALAAVNHCKLFTFVFGASRPTFATKMAARVCHAHFEKFAQARLEFVRNIAALAERPEYLEVSMWCVWRGYTIFLVQETKHDILHNDAWVSRKRTVSFLRGPTRTGMEMLFSTPIYGIRVRKLSTRGFRR